MGLIVYTRNLMLVGKARAARARASVESAVEISHPRCYQAATIKV
jgi:hypothetical protein